MRRAIRLNPHHPEWYWTGLGLALHTARQFSDAIDALLNNTNPSFLDLALLAASHAEIDRLADANAYADKLIELKPAATLGYFENRLPYRRDEDRDRLVSGLRKAGLPA